MTESDTAIALDSGDVPVLATPRLLAWAEAATVAAISGRLEPGATTVGSRVELTHRAPTPVGHTVTVQADLVVVEGNLLRFDVVAHDAAGRSVAVGTIVRVVVDRERFLAAR